jgi:hypothetical protein
MWDPLSSYFGIEKKGKLTDKPGSVIVDRDRQELPEALRILTQYEVCYRTLWRTCDV